MVPDKLVIDCSIVFTLLVITLFWTGFSEVVDNAESTFTLFINILPSPSNDSPFTVLMLVPLTKVSCLPFNWAVVA